jgi:hypothetical protein
MSDTKSTTTAVACDFKDEILSIVKLRTSAELFGFLIEDRETKVKGEISKFVEDKNKNKDKDTARNLVIPYDLAEAKRKLHDLAITTQELKDAIHEIYLQLTALKSRGLIKE